MKIFAGLRQRLATLHGERARSFVEFLWRRFVDDRCFETAGALSYTTVFALVPLSAVAFGVMSAFPVFQQWTERLSDFVFSSFVPDAARTVETYLQQFTASVSKLTVAGILALILSAVLTLSSIEATFNRIWRVKQHRPKLTRFLVYWTVLTLGALLAGAALALTSYLYGISMVSGARAVAVGERLIGWAPTLVELVAFSAAYLVIPNRRVPWRHALAGGLLATVLFELSKYGFGLYLRNVPSYQQIYGALAAIPIFLLWLYLGWVVILLGASFAATLSAFRFQPAALRLPDGAEFFGLLRLLGRLREAQRSGLGLHSAELHALEPSLSDDQLQRMLSDLLRIRVVLRSEAGRWLLSRDLRQVTLGELHEGCRLRIPVEDLRVPFKDDIIGKVAARAVESLRQPLRAGLSRDLSSLFAEVEEPRS